MLVFLVLSIITLPRIWLEIKHPLCCGWDIPYYPAQLHNYNIKLSPDEPLFFLLSSLLKPIFGVFVSVKILHIVLFILFSITFFILIKRYFDLKVALISLLILGFLPALTRIWADQYRNFLAFSLFPLFILLFLDDRKWYWLASGFVLGLIGLSHRMVFVFSIFTVFIFFLFKRKLDRFKKCLVIVIIGILLAFPYYYKEYLGPAFVRGEEEYKPKEALIKQREILLAWKEPPSVKGPLDLSSFLIIPALGVLFTTLCKEKSKIEELLLSIFIVGLLFGLGFFGTPFLIYFRYQCSLAFFTIFVFPIFLDRLFKEYKERNTLYKLIYLLILIAFLIPPLYFGFKFLQVQTPLVNTCVFNTLIENREMISKKDIALLVTSRLHRWIEALIPEKKFGKDLFVAEWYCLTGDFPRSDPRCGPDLIFNGRIDESIEEYKKLKEKGNFTKLYLIFDPAMEPINMGLINQKIFAGILECINYPCLHLCLFNYSD